MQNFGAAGRQRRVEAAVIASVGNPASDRGMGGGDGSGAGAALRQHDHQGICRGVGELGDEVVGLVEADRSAPGGDEARAAQPVSALNEEPVPTKAMPSKAAAARCRAKSCIAAMQRSSAAGCSQMKRGIGTSVNL